jgi:hypothetical protein
MNNKTLLSVLSWFVGFLMAVSSEPAVGSPIYFNDFDGTETFSGGAMGALTGVTTTVPVESLPAPFAGNMLQNDTGGELFPMDPLILSTPTILTLSNLPVHTSLDIDFALAIINTWDGIGGFPNGGNDQFNVLVDGTLVFSKIFAIQSGTSNYSPPANVVLGVGSYFDGGINDDQAFNMAFEPSLHNIAHTASSVRIQWFADGSGWQGGTDESWGMDNLSVSISNDTAAVPEPSSLMLLACGFATCVLGPMRLRRKRQ